MSAASAPRKSSPRFSTPWARRKRSGTGPTRSRCPLSPLGTARSFLRLLCSTPAQPNLSFVIGSVSSLAHAPGRYVNFLTDCLVSAHRPGAETAQKLDRNVFQILNLEHGL